MSDYGSVAETPLLAQLRQLQAALEEHRDRCAELYDHAPVGYLTLDSGAMIRELNLAAAALLGQDRGRLAGRRLTERTAPGQADRLLQHLRRVLDSGRPATLELSLQDSAGAPRHVELRSVAVQRGGEACCWSALFDITRHKRIEEALRDKEARLCAVLDTAADAIIVIDSRGVVQSFNPAAERMFGYAAAEIIGRNVRQLMPEPYRRHHDAYIRRYLRTRAPHIIGIGREVQGRRKDGGVFPMELAVSEAPDDELRFVGIIRDLTLRKAAEAALRDSEERFRQLAEHVQEVFWIVDLDQDRILYLSPAFETVWGIPRERVYRDPRGWMDSIHPDDLERVREHYQASRRAFHFDHQYRILRPDGSSRWIRDRGFPIRDAAGRIYRLAGLAEDITRAREAQALQDQSAHLARLGLAGELAAGLAHELNQPLSAIVTYAQLCEQLLESRDEPPVQFRELITKISAQGRRAGEIIAQLRRMVSKTRFRREPVDLNELVREAIHLIDAELRRHEVRLTLNLADAPRPVVADTVQIQQVLLNLIHNAVEAMGAIPPERRELTVATRPADRDEAVQVTVSDRGPGLDSADLERIFDPFFTTKSEGMGFGLSICRAIITSHEGRLWAAHVPGGGAAFHFTLPLAGTAA